MGGALSRLIDLCRLLIGALEEESVLLVISHGGEEASGGDVVDGREMGSEDWEALVAEAEAEDVVSVRVDKKLLLHHSKYFRSFKNFSGFDGEGFNVECSPATFCLLLECIHGFQPPFLSSMIAPLIQAAVYFGVDEVISRCRDWVESEMCNIRCGAEDGFLSDLLSIWSMAADNGEKAIEELCVKSLAINFAEAMVSESFVTLPIELLEAGVDHSELTIKSEMDLCNALLLWCENHGEDLHETYADFLFQKIQLDLLPLDFILRRLLKKYTEKVLNTQTMWSDLVFAKKPMDVWDKFPLNLVNDYSNLKPVIRLTEHLKELDLSFCQLVTCHHLVASADKATPTEPGILAVLSNMEKVNLSHCWRVEYKHLLRWLEVVCPNLLELRLQRCGLPLVMVLQVGSILPNLLVLDLSEPKEFAGKLGPVTGATARRLRADDRQHEFYRHGGHGKQPVPNRLRELSLRGRSEMTDVLLQRIAESCPSLEAVDLSGCSLLGDLGIQSFLTVYNLRKFTAAGTRFGPLSRKVLVSQADSRDDQLHQNLEILDLSRCSGLGSEDLSSLLGALGPCLVSLELAYTELNDMALSAFIGTSLKRLNLSETQVSGGLVSWILGRNPNMKDLNIRGCRRLRWLPLDFISVINTSEWEHVEAGWGLMDPMFSSLGFPCGKLQSLAFGIGGSISGQTLLSISEKCPQLRRLSLCFKVIPEEDLLHAIRKLTSLHTLELQYMSYTSGSLLREIACSLRDLKTLKLERVVPLLSDNDLHLFSQSCTSLRSLSLLGCQHLTDASLRTMTGAWRGLRDLRLEDCQHILTEDALRRLLASFQALEVLHLRHIGKVLPVNFIEDATRNLPLMQKLAIDICDSKYSQFLIPEGKISSQLTLLYMHRCRTMKDICDADPSSPYKRMTHKETIVLEWDLISLKESVVEERLTFD